MGFLSGLVSISSFLSGIVFGVLICIAAVLHFLNNVNSDDGKKDKQKSKNQSLAPDEPPKAIDELMKPEDVATFKRLIQFLDDFNAPMKSIGGYLQQIYKNRETNVKATKDLLDRKAKVVIEQNTINRMEEDLKASLSNLKEHGKTMKNISSFLADLGKVFASFSKDLSRLSNTAKNNMYKGLKDLNIDTKEDLIINNWWQALHVSLDYMASDQEYLGAQISDDLLTFSTQIHDELSVMEKRLSAEGSKQVHNVKEQLSLYETRRRERDKYREKVRTQGNSATLTTQSPAEIAQRRALKLKINDDQLSLQTSKLFAAQKEFFSLMPRIDADIQLTVLKSIVETHSQLLKLTESFERQQESNRMISKRMKLQLTNAAASLMQMIKEEGNFMAPSASSLAAAAAGVTGAEGVSSGMFAGADGTSSQSPEPEIVAYEDALRAKMAESGLQGYELSLQRVLEGLLHHCQHFDFTYGIAQSPQAHLQTQSQSGGAVVEDPGTGAGPAESRGELNMAKESTACLAAANPAILPALPSRFGAAVGVETCVWFNAFGGRVYRDISNSQYFYNWFCRKLTIMLNKGARPDYIDEFKVTDVVFGALPPMLLNVQWSPPCKSGPFSFSTDDPAQHGDRSKSGEGAGTSKGAPSSASASTSTPSRAFIYDESESSGSETEGQGEGGTKRRKSRFRAPPPKADDSEFFAACTADMAHRSGIKFTVTTKLWINWPRDRYASVPVALHLDLAEISGRIRFGVTRGHSFFSFLGDPLMRINVRNEVGKGAYKFKDFPQLSEFITKKLKAFVHNKIVHPHSHKFRLIWPRNWWPEGTQGEFGGDGEDTGSYKAPPTPPTAAVGVGAAAAPATAPGTPAPLGPHIINSRTARASTPPVHAVHPHEHQHEHGAPIAMNEELARERTVSLSDYEVVFAMPEHSSGGGSAANQSGDKKLEDSRAASTGNIRSASVASSSFTLGSASTGGKESSGAGHSSSSSGGHSSSYQAMRSKVTQWMNRRSSSSSATAASENDDHYHPLSRAAAQQPQQQPAGAAGSATASTTPFTATTADATTGPTARRPSASEQMKTLMTQARQSSIFKSPSTSASSGGGGAKGHAETHCEKEAMFGSMELQSHSGMQRDVVRDNLAWDLEVQNVINRYRSARRRAISFAAAVAGGVKRPLSLAITSSTERGIGVGLGLAWDEARRSNYRIAQRCLAAHARTRRRGLISMAEDTVASASAPSAQPQEQRGVSPVRGHTSRSNSITASGTGAGSPHGLSDNVHGSGGGGGGGLHRCRSYEKVEALPQRTSFSEPEGGGRLRSYSVDDFRPEVLDAMFVLRLVEGLGGPTDGSSQQQLKHPQGGLGPDNAEDMDMDIEMDSSTSKYRERPCIYPADPYRSVDDASYGYSSQRPMQFAQTGGQPFKQPGERATTMVYEADEDAEAAGGAAGGAPAYQLRQQPQDSRALPPRGTAQYRAKPTGPSSGYYTKPTSPSAHAASNPLHGVDIAAKFAEFKARHMNSKDIAKVFSRRPRQQDEHQQQQHHHRQDQQSGEEGEGEDDPPGMRAALVDPEEGDEEVEAEGEDISAGAFRGSFSGGGGKSAAALKYVSSIIRSKFHTATSPESSAEKDHEKGKGGKGGTS